MEPLDEYPLGPDRSDVATELQPERSWRGWAVIVVGALIAAALTAYFVTRPSRGSSTRATDQPAPVAQHDPAQARRALGPDVEARELPPLDLMDPVVRELLSGLSSRPELAAWLASDGLLRSFVASVDAVANGGTPSAHLRRLAPARPFNTVRRGDRDIIDPRSYQRYDGIAETVASLDAGGLARAYSILRPRLQDAYRELGYPDANFDSAVERAIGRLLDTPVLDGDVEVRRAPVLYQFASPRSEGLSAAQKQLLRMGPRNQRMIQDKLRTIATALGI